MTDFQIRQGDALEVLQSMEGGVAQTCVTSPPYWGLRDYGEDEQLGLEDTPQEYVRRLCDIFDEVKRVLRDDGTLWLNLGDCYSSGSSGQTIRDSSGGVGKNPKDSRDQGSSQAPRSRDPLDALPQKNLCMMPSRVAMELQRRGWYLRSRIVWAKNNPMPESVTDRPTSSHEYIFLLSPSERYFYDSDAIREGASSENCGNRERRGVEEYGKPKGDMGHSVPWEGNTRNKRDVWQVNTRPFPDAHFAVYPPELIEPCILAGTSEAGQCGECGAPIERDVSVERNVECERDRNGYDVDGLGGNESGIRSLSGDSYNVNRQTTGWVPTCDCDASTDRQTVLDPFAGAGTTGVVAARHGRNFSGVELNGEYIEMAEERIAEEIESKGELTPEQADEHTEHGQMGLLT